MNSKKLVQILLFACLLWSANTYPVSYGNTTSIVSIIHSDTLKLDDSKLEPRKFRDLNDAYSDEDFIYERNKENSGWWTRFKQWLSDLFSDWFDIKNSDDANNITDLMLKIGAIIIFLLVAYFIFKAVMNDEGKWIFGKSSDKNIIPVVDIESNLSITDFKKLTKEAENSEQYRLAIRYYYLWLLKNLSNAEVIDYDVEKTNSDYYNEISSEDIKKQFSYTSYLYNYIWYGEFDVSHEDFDKAKKAFTNFINSVKA